MVCEQNNAHRGASGPLREARHLGARRETSASFRAGLELYPCRLPGRGGAEAGGCLLLALV